MAIDRFFTGFEGGSRDAIALLSNILFNYDGKARTGQFDCYCHVPVAATNDGRAQAATPTAGQSIQNGHYATASMRVYFKLVAYPSASNILLAGYTTAAFTNYGSVVLNSTGHFAAKSGVTVGSYSTAILSLDTQYYVVITVVVTNPNVGSSTADVTASVYTENGTLVETVISNGGTLAAIPDIPPPTIGHLDSTSSTYAVRFDDWVSIIEDDGPATLPSANRVTRVDATGQSIAQWTGDYRKVIDIPHSAATGDEQTNNVLDAKSTFVHQTADELGLSGIAAIKVYAQLKTAVAGDEDILINSNITVVSAPGAYAPQPLTALSWQNYTNTDFNAFTFGVQNRRAQSVQLGQIYCEVLHSGTDPFKALLVGSGSWKQKVISYTGNGAFKTISGVGFRPQVIIVKKISSTGSAGAIKLGCMGGTQSKPVSTSIDSLGIQYITNDGFTLGPSTNVNEDGIAYIAVCFQDGGYGTDCKFLRYGTYVGDTIDGMNVVVKNGWQPTFVLVCLNAKVVYRTDLEVGDSSIQLTNLAAVVDFIQALNANGFEIGSSASNINTNDVFPYFAIKDNALLAPLFDYGSLVAAGAAEAITGLAFAPDFVVGKRIAAVDGQWRQTNAQAAPNSTIWGSTTTNATGITSLTADGFTLGSTLVQAGQTTKWFAFKADGSVTSSPAITVNAGVDQNVNAFTAAVLAGTASSTYACAAFTYAWTKISGPGNVTFTAPAALNTNASFDASGVYVLRLTVSDGLNSATDDIQITVINAAPVANAGPDLQGLYSAVFNLNGAANDDGLPIPPGVLTITWSKVSGPGLVAFTNPAVAVTTVTVSSSGIYTLRLTAYDGEKTVTDDMTLTALDGCVAPIANPVLPCGT
jgi:hypothetical protein